MTQANSTQDKFQFVCQQAVRNVYLWLPDLPGLLIKEDAWVDVLKQWVIAHQNHHLHICLLHERQAAQQLKSLTHLSQKLTSRISVMNCRSLPPTCELPESFFCNDQGEHLLLNRLKDDQVLMITEQRAKNRSLIDDFQQICRYSQRSKYFMPVSI